VSSEGTKYYQEVKLKVGFDKGTPEYKMYKEIEAKIFRVSRGGIVDV
jgi:hypothetical protein